MKRVVLGMVVATVAALSALAAPTFAAAASSQKCCIEHLHFAAGPYSVKSGANGIFIDLNVPKPKVDGYMLRMIPNMRYAKANGKCCGAIPPVSVIHLHHGVWLSNSTVGAGEGNGGYGIGFPFMATGEEKTIYELPRGYGYPIAGKDRWYFNYMIHDLIPTPAKVYVTYQIDFVPERTPLAKTLTAAHPIWMDVMDRHIYPVFNVMRHSGVNGKFTFPYMAKNPYPGPGLPLNQFVVDHAGTLVATAGHLHPGGLYDQLDDTRVGAHRHRGALPGIAPGSVRLFRSDAHYWDPRGPISWDMAMKGTAPDWRPAVKKGDVLSVSATYESRRAAWYESMGIMVTWEAWNSQRGIDVFTGKREAHPTVPRRGSGVNPFIHRIDERGHVTHGRLKENEDNGGEYTLYSRKLSTLRDCAASQVTIRQYVYNPGGFDATGKNLCIPTITQGQSVTFVNQDAPDTAKGFLFPNTPYGDAIFHTVSSCQNPCGLNTGISYPLVNGAGRFDSGQLGLGLPGTGKLVWTSPKGLKPGLYTYFCRIHPFMRGVFRVVGAKGPKA